MTGLRDRCVVGRVWLDVGAHYGELLARTPEDVTVYAFEPNLALVCRLIGRHPRYVVLPVAVTETDGCVSFYVTKNDSCSSTLPLDPDGVAGWNTQTGLGVRALHKVPSIRLDTFLERAGIEHVDYLKVDAQGADLAVVRSAGARLADIDRIRIEVQIARSPYAGAATKEEMVEYLEARGFRLIGASPQSNGQEQNLDFERVA